MSNRLVPFFCVGHRGAPALLPPGNTLASLQRAIEVGAEMLEVDVRRTADDILVLDHDPERSIDGRDIALRAYPYAQWQQWTAETDTPLPRLEDVLTLAKEAQVGLMLDFKEPGTEELLLQAIAHSEFPLDRLLIVGANDHSRALIRRQYPAVPLSLTLDHHAAGQITPAFLETIDTDAVTWHYTLLTPEITAALHQCGCLVYTWTVNAPEEMRRLREECHVDGIITNAPHVLNALLW